LPEGEGVRRWRTANAAVAGLLPAFAFVGGSITARALPSTPAQINIQLEQEPAFA